MLHILKTRKRLKINALTKRQNVQYDQYDNEPEESEISKCLKYWATWCKEQATIKAEEAALEAAQAAEEAALEAEQRALDELRNEVRHNEFFIQSRKLRFQSSLKHRKEMFTLYNFGKEVKYTPYEPMHQSWRNKIRCCRCLEYQHTADKCCTTYKECKKNIYASKVVIDKIIEYRNVAQQIIKFEPVDPASTNKCTQIPAEPAGTKHLNSTLVDNNKPTYSGEMNNGDITLKDQELVQDLKQDLKQDLEQDLVQELKQELKQNLKQELKQELEQELKQELEQEHINCVKDQLFSCSGYVNESGEKLNSKQPHGSLFEHKVMMAEQEMQNFNSKTNFCTSHDIMQCKMRNYTLYNQHQNLICDTDSLSNNASDSNVSHVMCNNSSSVNLNNYFGDHCGMFLFTNTTNTLNTDVYSDICINDSYTDILNSRGMTLFDMDRHKSNYDYVVTTHYFDLYNLCADDFSWAHAEHCTLPLWSRNHRSSLHHIYHASRQDQGIGQAARVIQDAQGTDNVTRPLHQHQLRDQYTVNDSSMSNDAESLAERNSVMVIATNEKSDSTNFKYDTNTTAEKEVANKYTTHIQDGWILNGDHKRTMRYYKVISDITIVTVTLVPRLCNNIPERNFKYRKKFMLTSQLIGCTTKC